MKSEGQSPTENSGGTVASHATGMTNLRPWPKGISGNPGGRPKKRLIDQTLEELLLSKDSALASAIAEALLARAQRGDVRAIQLVAERTQGRPKQAMEVSGPDGGALAFENLTEQEIDERITALLERWNGGK